MRRTCTTLAVLYVTVFAFVQFAAPATAQITIYHDRALFEAALSGAPHQDDYEPYALGDIASGAVRGDFRYSFDASVTQAAIVPGGSGGQALGGSPFDVFVGGDLVFLEAGSGSKLTAFGADFLYAPSFDTIPADTYRLAIERDSLGEFVGNLDSIDPSGGSFFLGLIVDPGFEFFGVALFSSQLDPNFVVPAYQVDNLIYAGKVVSATPAVPEPGALGILALGGMMLAARLRRRTYSAALNPTCSHPGRGLSVTDRKGDTMQRLKVSLLAAAGILILAFALNVVGPKRVMAALGYTPVRDVDGPGRQPFSASVTVGPISSTNILVPAGKRLVITCVSAENFTLDFDPILSVHTNRGSNIWVPFSSGNRYAFATLTGSDIASADGGGSNLSVGSVFQTAVNVTGYLVDVP